jgi:agmatine deiminase
MVDSSSMEDTALDRNTQLLAAALSLFCTGCTKEAGRAGEVKGEGPAVRQVRVPGEWEAHAATWLQWPGPWESQLRPAFADIVSVIQGYEPVHVLAGSQAEVDGARELLTELGIPDSNVTWHALPVDNAWMRDNGPVYVTDGLEAWVADFRFDAWGGNFGGGIPYGSDDSVPVYVAEQLGMERKEYPDYVLERGNLEFNGAGVLALSWDCQDDRNPGMSQADHEEILAEAFGAEQILWTYGHDPADGTTGHVDGYARFVDEGTIAIGETEWGWVTEDALAADCGDAGLEVVRIPALGGTSYMNWLVGNGFVLGMAFGAQEADEAAAAQLAALYPGRDVHMVEAGSLWESGGGVHCVTSDQPILP